MNTEPSWDLYRTFAAVLRNGSLSGAARELGITQPSVSRHIEELERLLATTLFLRSQRGLSPTDRAVALGPYADELVTTAAALVRAASAPDDEVTGTVRITASEVVAVEHLPPILAELRREHPSLGVELVLSNAVDDLLGRQADIAVRMVEPTQQALVARRVGSVTLGFHARRDYLARRGSPATLAELASFDVLGPDTNKPGIRAILRDLPPALFAKMALRTDSDLAQLAAIRAGMGIGVAQVEVARRYPGLIHILAGEFAPTLPLWIVMHEDLRSSRRCRVVYDALAEGLAAL